MHRKNYFVHYYSKMGTFIIHGEIKLKLQLQVTIGKCDCRSYLWIIVLCVHQVDKSGITTSHVTSVRISQMCTWSSLFRTVLYQR